MTVPRICITDGGGWAVRDYPDSEWPWTARPERPHAVLQPLADAAIDHGDWRELIVIDPVDIPNAHSEPSVAVAVPAYEWIEIPGTGIEIAHQLGEALAVEYRAARGEPVDEYGPREGYPYPFDPRSLCSRLAGHTGLHVAGDGDDWGSDDNDPKETR